MKVITVCCFHVKSINGYDILFREFTTQEKYSQKPFDISFGSLTDFPSILKVFSTPQILFLEGKITFQNIVVSQEFSSNNDLV